jgi:hypothetical protein
LSINLQPGLMLQQRLSASFCAFVFIVAGENRIEGELIAMLRQRLRRKVPLAITG